nr:enoyl-CoA hydratase-related protein [Streptomyces sp. DSM 41633]
VRSLTLIGPESRNALSTQLRTEFYGALRTAQADDAVDVVLLTGADPVFCAGLDLKDLGDTTELPDISPKWPAMTKPVIGAINGAAVTGGLELALYCDILIASEQAKPDGLVLIEPGTERELLAPMPVRTRPGVGPATGDHLRRAGMTTVHDLAEAGEAELVRLVGKAHGHGLYRMALGLDDRPVVAERDA